MGSYTCNCSQNSSVTLSAQRIRCLGCQRLLPISIRSYGVWTTGPPSEVKSLELEKKKNEAESFHKSFVQRFSRSYPPQAQTSRIPPTVTAYLPPRGKRALICGVSYKKQKYELKGTAQDVKNIKNLLIQEYSFPEESILILAEGGLGISPTRKNIEDALRCLVRGVRSGDSLVFYFSGHGKRQRDLIGDEIDGFDETICPMDFETNGVILDNDINDAIVRPLPKDVTLHAIVDSCHSGTVLDLPHAFNFIAGKWDDNRPPSGTYKGTNGGKAICFSACEDYQLAADTSAFSVEKEMTGAMTTTFIQAIKASFFKKEKLTYQGILDYMHLTLKQAHKKGHFSSSIRRIFHRRILQDPLLSASEVFSTNAEFKL